MSQMQAWRVREFCEPEDMAFETVARPEPGPGQALVRVHTAALNFLDILMVQGKYQMKPDFPFTPGCELSGEIAAVGPGSSCRVGQRVAAQSYWGAFAEYAVVDDLQINPIPDGVAMDRAACVPVVYPTGHIALGRRGGLKAGEWLLVTAGAGGSGLAAIQIGRAWGAHVIALAGSEEKLAVCRAHGAELALDYTDDGWVEAVREATGGRGADVIFDPVGGEVFNLALKVIAVEGRALIIGFAGGAIQQIAANRLLLKNASAVGAIWGGFFRSHPEYTHEVVADCYAMLARGAIDPVVSARYAFDDLPAALRALASRRTWGKVLLEVSS